MPFGLGGAPRLSFLIVDWPDGLFQGEVPGLGDGERDAPTLAAGEICRIPEIQRQVSSCPVLFAHDGEDFRFVSDVLGVAGIGYLLEPGVYSEPRPRERFPMPSGTLSPDEEVDSASCSANRWRRSAISTRSSSSAGPCPRAGRSRSTNAWRSAAPPRPALSIFHRTTIDPVRAFDVDGRPIHEAIASVDRVAAAIPEKDRRFIGRLAREHVVTLEFDRPLPTSSEDARPWLLMDGWVEYPYAQTMFAAWQASATYEAPTLEARDATGAWRIVQEQFGYPAGMPRTAAYPLDALPEGCDALRLRTNQEMYWDRLRVVVGEPAAEGRRAASPSPRPRVDSPRSDSPDASTAPSDAPTTTGATGRRSGTCVTSVGDTPTSARSTSSSRGPTAPRSRSVPVRASTSRSRRPRTPTASTGSSTATAGARTGISSPAPARRSNRCPGGPSRSRAEALLDSTRTRIEAGR